MNDITDLSDTIIAKSDQLNASDLMGVDKIIKISSVVRYKDKGVNKFYLNYEGDCGRPYKPSLTMRRIIGELWTLDGNFYIGRYLKLHRDPTITYGKEECGGIVITAMSDIKGKSTIKLQVRRGQLKTFIVDVLQPVDKPAWPDDAFSKQFEKMGEAVKTGAMTPEQMITKFQSKGDLSDSQREKIRALGEVKPDIDNLMDDGE